MSYQSKERTRGNESLLGFVASGKATIGRPTNRPDQVLDVSRQCVALFARSYNDRTLSTRAEEDIQNQLGRFKIWAGTIGVFASGKASADSRLRNDEDVKEIMIDMLLRLRRAIDALLKPVIMEESSEEPPSDGEGSSDDSEESLVLSIGGESDTTSMESKILDHHNAALQDIDNVISKLYRLSALIRKPTSTRENVRVANYIEKGDVAEDATDFETHLRWQIKFRLPDASDGIVDRLVRAVMFRRRKLEYRKRHQQKLSQGMESAFGTEVLLSTMPTTARNKGTLAQRGSGPLLKSPATVKSSSNTITLSATEASTVNRRALASYPRSMAGGSNITKSAVARREQLDVPPPPKSADTAEAICPYCFEVVDKANMARPLWTRHILKDIDPYVCLFEGCNRPTEQYQSFDDWISHMKWQHTLAWSCQAPRHTDLSFDTSEECEMHMRQDHSEDISMDQLALLVEKSAHPAADPLGVLVRYEQVGSEERSVCPLCPFAIQNTRIPQPYGLIPDASASIDDGKLMRDHVAEHLESIALLSLPEQEIDDAATNEVESESARISTTGEDHDLEPISHLTSEDWDKYEETEALSALDIEDTIQEPVSPSGYEDWSFVNGPGLPKGTSNFDPGSDPVLLPFVERARRIQTAEIQKRLGIPLLVVSDPGGLEIPEAQWAVDPEQMQAHTVSATQLHNVGPSSSADNQRMRKIKEAKSESSSVPDSLPSLTNSRPQGIPTIHLVEADD